MQPGCFPRAILAALLGLGVMAGLLQAADALPMPNSPPPTTLVPPIPEQGPILTQPTQTFGPAPMPTVQQPFATGDVVYPGAPPKTVEKPHSICGCIKRYFIANVPICCWATHNTLGCGNFGSEFNFVFGSCRTFYGEPCYRGPPPPPVPLEYLNRYGPQALYGSQKTNDCHCP
jgi:hypothetical protein